MTSPALTGTKGGSGVYQRIISQIPQHKVYIEPFWGRGTIARKKRPAEITIGVDLDEAARASANGVAARFFLADGVQWLRDYLDRLPPETASGSNAATFGGFAVGEHFVYLDPPYLNCGEKYYDHWLTEEEHRVLCRLFLRLPCPAALSGYRSDVYDAELGGARAIDIPTVNRRGHRVTETVWFNYPEPTELHDTRYLGWDRRVRERIKRRVKNWSAGLARMPATERQAVWEACRVEFERLRD